MNRIALIVGGLAWIVAIGLSLRTSREQQALDLAVQLLHDAKENVVVTDDAFAVAFLDHVGKRGETSGPVLLTRTDLSRLQLQREPLPCGGEIDLVTHNPQQHLDVVLMEPEPFDTAVLADTGYALLRYRRR